MCAIGVVRYMWLVTEIWNYKPVVYVYKIKMVCCLISECDRIKGKLVALYRTKIISK